MAWSGVDLDKVGGLTDNTEGFLGKLIDEPFKEHDQKVAIHHVNKASKDHKDTKKTGISIRINEPAQVQLENTSPDVQEEDDMTLNVDRDYIETAKKKQKKVNFQKMQDQVL